MYSTPQSRRPNARLMVVRSSICGCPRRSLTRSRISNRASRRRAEDAVVGPNIVGMEEAGVTEAEEPAVEAEAEGGDEAAPNTAAPEAVECTIPTHRCTSWSLQ
jgi:hypothetical protein